MTVSRHIHFQIFKFSNLQILKLKSLVQYIYTIADNALILGQRLGELCGHGPSLETDIALTNISLDLFGQVRSYYQYAASVLADGSTEDTHAFLRNERQYLNALLAEQPNTDFAYTIGRQFLYDVFHVQLLTELSNSKDETLAAIAKKSLKEVLYHRRFSSDWVKRLGDGTDESRERMQAAINDLWMYTNELFEVTDAEREMADAGIGVDVSKLKDAYYKEVGSVLNEATLEIPQVQFFHKGGKQGVHTENLGYILADMQYMQRTFPNMTW